MSFLGPILGSDVATHYKIAWADFKGYEPNIRALFRFAYAADVLHIHEDPRGSNTGPEINRILNVAKVGPGNPWCASAGYCYLLDSGADAKKLPENPASVHNWGAWAKANGRILNGPERGCAGLIYHTPTTGHWVIVANVAEDGSTLESIAGNTNTDGSREGYEFARHTYGVNAFAAFVDLTKLS